MQPCNSLDDILQHMDPSTIQGYKTFMHEVIIQGICYHNLHQKRSSPLGIEHVRAMTSLFFYKTHVGIYSSTHNTMAFTVISRGANDVDLEAEKFFLFCFFFFTNFFVFLFFLITFIWLQHF